MAVIGAWVGLGVVTLSVPEVVISSAICGDPPLSRWRALAAVPISVDPCLATLVTTVIGFCLAKLTALNV